MGNDKKNKFMTSAKRRAQSGKQSLSDRPIQSKMVNLKNLRLPSQLSPFGRSVTHSRTKMFRHHESFSKRVPIDGNVGIYLDDERACPEGWTLTRTAEEFYALLEPERNLLHRITHLSLDWYLGTGCKDGVAVCKNLAERFLSCHHDDGKVLRRKST